MSSIVGKGGSPKVKAKRLKGNSTGVRAKAELKKALQDGTLKELLWRDLSRKELSDPEDDPASQIPIVFDDEDTDDGSEVPVTPEAEQKSEHTHTVPNNLTSDCSKLLFRGSAKLPRLSSAVGGLPQFHQERRTMHLKPDDGDSDRNYESPTEVKAPRLRAFTQIMQKLRSAANEAKFVPTQEAQSSDSEASEAPEVPGEQDDTIAPVAVSILAVQGCKK
jgi:hypothetical protein